MSKYLTAHSIVGIVIAIIGIAYLMLHRKAPSTVSGIHNYPSSPVKVAEPETNAPEYLTINQPSVTPIQSVDLSGNPLAPNMSYENLTSIYKVR